MMMVDHVQIQLIDTPPLDRDYIEPELLDLIRRADLVLLVVDLQTYPIQQIEDTLLLLEDHNIIPLRFKNRHSPDRLTRYVPIKVLVNKYDDESADEVFEILCQLIEGDWECMPVSAVTERNLDNLRRTVYQTFDIIRVYPKPPGEEPDLSSPFVLNRGSTVEEFASKIHLDFYHNLKSARLWGSSAFDGQKVGRDHILEDGDIVELRI
jgi:ribosome-interacting GTPase 1